MVDIIGLLKKPSFLIKLLELVLAIIAVILLEDLPGIVGLTNSTHRVALVYMVYCGYILLLLMHIIERIMDVETPKTVAMAWAFTGCIMWLTAGGMLLKAYDDIYLYPLLQKWVDEFLATGILGIVNGCTFFVEVGLIFKFE